MGELDGKVAIVTGGGSGQGESTAHVFAREGAKGILVADISGRQEEVASAIGKTAQAFKVDVTDEASVEAMYAAAVEAFGKVDVVAHTAGIGHGGALADMSMDDWNRVIGINLTGVMLGTKHAIRTMVPTGGGVILNWSSIGGMNGSRMPTSAYGAAKHGVIAITKQAAIEYGMQGIRANAICPGFIETPMSGGKGAAERFPALVQGSALKRGAQPEEVAELASFLASDRASYITGAAIPIDGGSTAIISS